MRDRTRSFAGSGTVSEITVDEERWAEALTIERSHGDSAVDRGGSVHLNSSARLLSGASAGFMPLREAAG